MGALDFDYEVLAICEYPIYDVHGAAHGCGEPATHRVWWKEDASDAMLVCREHFSKIKALEKTLAPQD